MPEIGVDPATFVEMLIGGCISSRSRFRKRIASGIGSIKKMPRGARCNSRPADRRIPRHLQMEAELGPIDESVLARIVHLLGKTNQFNLTTRRHAKAKCAK